jgi:hypothetical protein
MSGRVPPHSRNRAAWAAALLIPTFSTPTLATGSGNPVANGGRINACELVSVGEAQEALGAEVTTKPIDTSAAGPEAASMCSYQTGHVGGGFMLLAGRLQYDDAAAEAANREKEAVSNLPPGIPTPTFKDVSGLGEAAYLAETPESLELHVLDHGSVIVLTMNRKPDGAAESLAERLAGFAIRRLESQADR